MSSRPASIALLAAVMALAVAGFAACGGDDDSGSASELAALVPPDVPLYAEAVVRPEGEQRDEVESALGTLLNTDDPGGMIVEALNEELEEDSGLSYEDDVEPWLGERAAIFASEFDPEPAYAMMIETTDSEAAMEAVREGAPQGIELDERTYEGAEYLVEEGEDEFEAVGTVDEQLVIGSVSGFEAVVDAAAGESLADAGGLGPEYEQLADGLFAFYADPAAAVDAVAATGELPRGQLESFEQQLGATAEGPVVGGVDAAADTFSFEFSTVTAGAATTASDLFADLPADAWLAFGAGNLGAAAAQAIASFDAQLEASPFLPPQAGLQDALRRELGIDLREDVLSWIGDVAAYARGTSIFGLAAALIVETDDEQATVDALERLRTALERNPDVQVAPLGIEGEGFELRFPGAPVQVPIVVRDGRLIAGLGEASVEEALDPEERLGDSDAYEAATSALGEDLDPSLLLEFAPIVELIESTGAATDDPDYAEAKPYLDALDFLASGQREDGDRTTIRLVLGVDEPEE